MSFHFKKPNCEEEDKEFVAFEEEDLDEFIGETKVYLPEKDEHEPVGTDHLYGDIALLEPIIKLPVMIFEEQVH